MPVQYLPYNPGKGSRHVVEDLVVEGTAIGLTADERVRLQVVPVIPDRLFFGSPPGFKLHQSMIARLGSPKGETLTPVPDAQSDRFPHGKVVCAKMLVLPVGSPVFVDRLSAVMKADYSRNVPALVGSQRNKSKAS